MSFTSVDLPEPDTPVTHTKQPSGISTSMSCRLCSRAPRMRSWSSPGTRRACGTGIDRLPGQVLTGERRLRAQQALERSRVDDVATVLARAGPDVDDVIGDADRVLVVLDDQHRVAQLAQAHQGVDQPTVVALVQPDRRLVEHVEHTDQAAADLRGQPDPLRLAAGEGGRRPTEREVVETDVEQETHARVDLLDDALGDHAIALGQVEARREPLPPHRSTCSTRR